MNRRTSRSHSLHVASW